MAKHTRNRTYDHVNLCEHCGETFYSSRYDAKFCPAPKTCRQDYNREQKQREKLFTKAWRAFNRWQSTTTATRYLTAQEARDLIQIKQKIEDILSVRDYQLALLDDDESPARLDNMRDMRLKSN